MRYPVFVFDPSDAMRTIIREVAERRGLVIEDIDARTFRVACPTDDDVYRFGLATGKALRAARIE